MADAAQFASQDAPIPFLLSLHDPSPSGSALLRPHEVVLLEKKELQGRLSSIGSGLRCLVEAARHQHLFFGGSAAHAGQRNAEVHRLCGHEMSFALVPAGEIGEAGLIDQDHPPRLWLAAAINQLVTPAPSSAVASAPQKSRRQNGTTSTMRRRSMS
ncbi:hypothetical protein CXZ10_06045 [Pleomorphomonas diazotrophica]|uniref:Uncharacterized protein n=1 Tax=Pleomorphomonas diazotrophica TaxID=1166257 RepID=A0A2N3M204_9HYPH|nr:hypothetical protein CXZ10_06045 [Pleomorphomonas diazotrophica]